MMLSGDQPANTGRRVGRQIAIIATPSSTMPQNRRSETTPMSSVAGRPATVAFCSTNLFSHDEPNFQSGKYLRDGAKISIKMIILVNPHAIALLHNG